MFWKNHNSENAVSHTPRPQKVARLVLAAAASVAIAAPVSFISTRTARAADPVEINRDNQRMSAADQKKMEEGFFKRAASGNSLEIRLAKLAEERATDPQVKQLAMTIQHDHEDANRILALQRYV